MSEPTKVEIYRALRQQIEAVRMANRDLQQELGRHVPNVSSRSYDSFSSHDLSLIDSVISHLVWAHEEVERARSRAKGAGEHGVEDR